MQVTGLFQKRKGAFQPSNQDFELVKKENGGAPTAPPFLVHPL